MAMPTANLSPWRFVSDKAPLQVTQKNPSELLVDFSNQEKKMTGNIIVPLSDVGLWVKYIPKEYPMLEPR